MIGALKILCYVSLNVMMFISGLVKAPYEIIVQMFSVLLTAASVFRQTRNYLERTTCLHEMYGDSTVNFSRMSDVDAQILH